METAQKICIIEEPHPLLKRGIAQKTLYPVGCIEIGKKS
jgi:hypothetical protein